MSDLEWAMNSQDSKISVGVSRGQAFENRELINGANTTVGSEEE